MPASSSRIGYQLPQPRDQVDVAARRAARPPAPSGLGAFLAHLVLGDHRLGLRHERLRRGAVGLVGEVLLTVHVPVRHHEEHDQAPDQRDHDPDAARRGRAAASTRPVRSAAGLRSWHCSLRCPATSGYLPTGMQRFPSRPRRCRAPWAWRCRGTAAGTDCRAAAASPGPAPRARPPGRGCLFASCLPCCPP